MSYMVLLFVVGLLLGMIVVASNPSPYFAALGLMGVSGLGCGLLVVCGDVFLSLVLFLIYLGGMLVVFAYSSALASDLFPEALGSRRIMISWVIYFLMVVAGVALFWEEWWFEGVGSEGNSDFSVLRGEIGGVASVYLWGGWMLVLVGWGLLITLFVVLEVVRGGSHGALRAV
uniref:NADH dehydrogenase subunit 6 n=1 Tax=Trimma macrophthalmum TaxID=1478008 RepID=UPI00286AAE2E|nr:NADH dehydrogenase subunit 6 [Trimma macrophthalmum]WKD79691.1 NADH dehydrogenase subunit 6 [Trimma macrophthalmum]